MRKPRIILATVVAATATAVLALTACGPTLPAGPAGRVIDKDRDYRASTKTYWNYLTVRTAGGSEQEFRVSKSNYDSCKRGSSYPKCTEGS
ncbi:hypothetical protein ACFYPC_08910 [Streptomyces sp. NPDC005808]|uniref:hypothetical protein n=1 Tax=Streptomyces sp. NPDC005808 TaxID=3364734 RepID=UPI0036B23C98